MWLVHGDCKKTPHRAISAGTSQVEVRLTRVLLFGFRKSLKLWLLRRFAFTAVNCANQETCDGVPASNIMFELILSVDLIPSYCGKLFALDLGGRCSFPPCSPVFWASNIIRVI